MKLQAGESSKKKIAIITGASSGLGMEFAKQIEEKPFKEWEAKVADTQLPRYVEDIIDALDEPTKAKIAKQTLDLYEEKKTIRAQKPMEK